jgi:hypothetical protein
MAKFGAPGRNEVELWEHEFFIQETADSFQCSVAFRNVGAGVAVVTSAGTVPSAPGDVVVSRNFVPRGERVRVNVSVQVALPEARALLNAHHSGSFSVAIGYSDADGGQPLISRADVQTYATHETWVRQIAISHRGEREPFVISAPSDG